MRTALRRAWLVGLGATACHPIDALAQGGRETIVIIRHGEKPKEGLGQLSCRGLNRALALPSVLEAKFGKPTAMFAANPSVQKEDGDKAYSYLRPLAAIEPSAIRFGLPVDVSYGYPEIGKVKLALEQPIYRDATIVVVWEHHLIDALAKSLLADYGGGEQTVPEWHGHDYDGIYIVTIDWMAKPPKATFYRDHQGLDGLPEACPM